MAWRFIETFDPAIHDTGSECLLAGTYPNGIQWTRAAYWDSRGWFSGHKTDTFKPTHWQPMPEPPSAEEDEAVRCFMAMIG